MMNKPQDVSVTRGESGVEGTLVNGALHGGARIYADGVMLAILRYAHGRLGGPATLLYPDGTPSAQLNYADDKLDGKAVYYAQDGTVQCARCAER
jgi:antitoxin component YwqK of YwqJK toxin-antitoxin module